MASKYLTTTDGVKLHYVINKIPKAPVVVMLHAIGQNHSKLLDIQEFFTKKGYSTLLIDHRCHGKSGKGAISQVKFVEDIEEIIRKENINKFILLGDCTGANIALMYYEKNKKDVQQLILITPSFLRDATLLTKGLCVLGYGLLGFVMLKDTIAKKPSAKQFVDWSKNKNLEFLPFLSLIRRNMRFIDYLLSLQALLYYHSSYDYLNKDTIVFFLEKDELINYSSLKNKQLIKITLTGNHFKKFNVDGLVPQIIQQLNKVV